MQSVDLRMSPASPPRSPSKQAAAATELARQKRARREYLRWQQKAGTNSSAVNGAATVPRPSPTTSRPAVARAPTYAEDFEPEDSSQTISQAKPVEADSSAYDDDFDDAPTAAANATTTSSLAARYLANAAQQQQQPEEKEWQASRGLSVHTSASASAATKRAGKPAAASFAVKSPLYQPLSDEHSPPSATGVSYSSAYPPYRPSYYATARKELPYTASPAQPKSQAQKSTKK
jgi:hypothetical protein